MPRTATLPRPLSYPGDRRRSFRQPLCAAGAVIDETNHARTLDVVVLNVSTTGVAFRAPVRFNFGTCYKLRIGNGPLHLTSRLKVVDSRERDEGVYDIAGRFI